MMSLIKKEKKLQKKICHICKKESDGDNDDGKNYQKVRDHCHCTGKFRGAAHSICHLRSKHQKKFL